MSLPVLPVILHPSLRNSADNTIPQHSAESSLQHEDNMTSTTADVILQIHPNDDNTATTDNETASQPLTVTTTATNELAQAHTEITDPTPSSTIHSQNNQTLRRRNRSTAQSNLTEQESASRVNSTNAPAADPQTEAPQHSPDVNASTANNDTNNTTTPQVEPVLACSCFNFSPTPFQLVMFHTFVFILFFAMIILAVFRWREADVNFRWVQTFCKTDNWLVEEDPEDETNFRVSARILELNRTGLPDVDIELGSNFTAYYGVNDKYYLNSTASKKAFTEGSTPEDDLCWVEPPNISIGGEEKSTEPRISLAKVEKESLPFSVWIPLFLATFLGLFLMFQLSTYLIDQFTISLENRRETIRRVAALTQPANAAGNRAAAACLTSAQARFVCNVFGHEWYPDGRKESRRRKSKVSLNGIEFNDGLGSNNGTSPRSRVSSRLSSRVPSTIPPIIITGTSAVAQESGNAENGTESPKGLPTASTVRKKSRNVSQPPDDWTCAICLDGPDKNSKSVVRTVVFPCGHRFHRACIRHWLRKGRPSCPLCQWDVRVLFDNSGAPAKNVVVSRSQVIADAVVSDANGNDATNAEEEGENDAAEQVELNSYDMQRFTEGVEMWQMISNQDSMSSSRIASQPVSLRNPEEFIPQ